MRNVRNLVVIGAVIVVIIGAAVAYAVLRPPATASGPIQAVPLEESNAAATITSAERATSLPAEAATTAPAATAASEPEATAASEPVATTASEPAATTASATGTMILAQIVSGESEARFVIDEVLNNAPKTVVGATDQVAGELEVDTSDPSKTRIGVIQVNARTLSTDSEFRNRAIKNQILSTDQYEFITFTPTDLQGLPSSVTSGQSYTFKIVGDLTIKDVTKQVTFDVTATPESDTRLTGLAQTTIRYADYNITIPQVPQVASVDENVRLEIEFVAAPKQG